MTRRTLVRFRARRVALAILLIALPGVLVSEGALSGRADPLERYIVVLEPGVEPMEMAGWAASAWGAGVLHVYETALPGFSAGLTETAVAALSADERVSAVVRDREVWLAAEQRLPTGVDRIEAEPAIAPFDPKVVVNAAILDSGIDAAQPDLNLVGGKNCLKTGSYRKDRSGHGTHGAGTVAARHNQTGVVGVAPGLRLYSVRVLNRRGGWWSSVLCGIDWVAATRTDSDPSNDIAVANMSFGGQGSDDGACGHGNGDPFHLALCAADALGVVFVAAAGNAVEDFAGTVPAAYDEVLTVTAIADYDGRRGGQSDATCFDSGRDDHAAVFSNYADAEGDDESGDALHTIAAPGVCILSTLPGGRYGFSSGTSSAAPHVTGLVARCLAELACLGPPAAVIQYVRERAERGTREDPGFGFVGDPLRKIDDRYYGFLARLY